MRISITDYLNHCQGKGISISDIKRERLVIQILQKNKADAVTSTKNKSISKSI